LTINAPYKGERTPSTSQLKKNRKEEPVLLGRDKLVRKKCTSVVRNFLRRKKKIKTVLAKSSKGRMAGG